MESVIINTRRIPAIAALMFAGCLTMQAQNNVTVSGVVVDATGEPIPGATVIVKGNSGIGMTTDIDGNFSLKVPAGTKTLVVSFVGMVSQEVQVGKGPLSIVLSEDKEILEEVVVVGYGQQKKASVVGAITQATGEQLTRAAGINDLSQALTGNLPGVVTMSSNGMPGQEETHIVIRGQSSWNNSDPLILVDGIERPMSSVDMQSVASISVLKDASATAVYGVKGANGVILITTKRGQEGRAQINVNANAIMKVPSKLPGKFDSYDALVARNIAIEHEMNIDPSSFANKMLPMNFIANYRQSDPTARDEFGNLLIERYPNVDWQDALFKDFCMSYNANINVSGGTKFVKYFASLDYVNEGDLYKTFDNGRAFDNSYSYHKVNMRSNLDFSITKTTVLKVNMAGSTALRHTPWTNLQWNGDEWQIAQQWSGIYNISPDCFMPKYSDGTWGFLPGTTNITNSAQNFSIGGGTQEETTTRLTTDFVLEQDLSFITKGLALHGLVAWDNVFFENGRGVNDTYKSDDPQLSWIDPFTGLKQYAQPYESYDQFDYEVGNRWEKANGSVNDWATQRNFNYQVQLNWARQFGKHDITAMGNFGRQEYARGNMVPSVREDWVFRATYNWANRYNAEYNGAYNGSEKFSKDNRFAFFQSWAAGWTISEEPFMKFLKERRILDLLKVRFSYGEIGDDNVADRFLYATQWAPGVTNKLDTDLNNNSPYSGYYEQTVGNPDIHWEVVKKTNIGVDYSFLNGLLAGSLEFFRDRRTDIIVAGNNRSLPSYFGATAPSANIGEVKTNGYELELRFNKVLRNQMRIWANLSMTHAENLVVNQDDLPNLPAYRKKAGYTIGQTSSHISKNMVQTMDELYATPKHDKNDDQKLVGDYYIVDFDGNGRIDQDDQAPYGYSGIPQNTYNATLGWEWKGWSANVQFYGVSNVTRDVTMLSFGDPQINTVFDEGTWWSQDQHSADVVTPRYKTTPSYYHGTQYMRDASYIRLKNAEVGYTFKNEWTRKIGLSNVKLFVSGNNLWIWSNMPDDRESNFSGASSNGAYPTMRRFNFGLKFSL